MLTASKFRQGQPQAQARVEPTVFTQGTVQGKEPAGIHTEKTHPSEDKAPN